MQVAFRNEGKETKDSCPLATPCLLNLIERCSNLLSKKISPVVFVAFVVSWAKGAIPIDSVDFVDALAAEQQPLCREIVKDVKGVKGIDNVDSALPDGLEMPLARMT